MSLPNSQGPTHSNTIRHRVIPIDSSIQVANRSPDYWINTHEEPFLQGEALIDIADDFRSLELLIVNFCSRALELSTWPDVDTQELDRLKQCLYDTKKGEDRYHPRYLESRALLKYWDMADSFQKLVLHGFRSTPDSTHLQETQTWVEKWLEVFDKTASPLQQHLLAAAQSGQLSPKVVAAIHDRMLNIDLISDQWSRKARVRGLLPWNELRQNINKELTVQVHRQKDTWPLTLFWLTITSWIAMTLPILVLAWQYSTDERGTVATSDFYFLVQSVGTQLIGLLIMGVTVWMDKTITTLSRILALMAVVVSASLNVFSLIVFCFAQKRWSSLLGIVAGALQAFVTVQVTSIAYSAAGTKVKPD